MVIDISEDERKQNYLDTKEDLMMILELSGEIVDESKAIEYKNYKEKRMSVFGVAGLFIQLMRLYSSVKVHISEDNDDTKVHIR